MPDMELPDALRDYLNTPRKRRCPHCKNLPKTNYVMIGEKRHIILSCSGQYHVINSVPPALTMSEAVRNWNKSVELEEKGE